jgi:hypothetical protein
MSFPVDERVSIFPVSDLDEIFSTDKFSRFSPYSPPTHSPDENSVRIVLGLGVLTRLCDDSDEERLTTTKETSIHERLDEVGFDAGVFL